MSYSLSLIICFPCFKAYIIADGARALREVPNVGSALETLRDIPRDVQYLLYRISHRVIKNGSEQGLSPTYCLIDATMT